MLKKVDYYSWIAKHAVSQLNGSLDNLLVESGLDDDDADERADDRTIQDCDLSPFQLADFLYGENDPYSDYEQFSYGEDLTEEEYYKHVAYEAVPVLDGLYEHLYNMLGYWGDVAEDMADERTEEVLRIEWCELDCFLHGDGDAYDEYVERTSNNE